MKKIELTNDDGQTKFVDEHVVDDCLKVGWYVKDKILFKKAKKFKNK